MGCFRGRRRCGPRRLGGRPGQAAALQGQDRRGKGILLPGDPILKSSCGRPGDPGILRMRLSPRVLRIAV